MQEKGSGGDKPGNASGGRDVCKKVWGSIRSDRVKRALNVKRMNKGKGKTLALVKEGSAQMSFRLIDFWKCVFQGDMVVPTQTYFTTQSAIKDNFTTCDHHVAHKSTRGNKDECFESVNTNTEGIASL